MLEDFIMVNEVKAEIMIFEKPVMTKKEVDKIKMLMKIDLPVAKSILFIADKQPVLAILLDEDMVSRKKLKDILKAKEIRMAFGEEVEDITGYEVGAVPPISIYGVSTVLDKKVLNHPKVLAGGGTTHALLKIEVPEFERVIEDLKIEDISE